MSQLHGNIQMMTNADLDKFVDIIAAKVEAKIMANQQKRDIQNHITKALPKHSQNRTNQPKANQVLMKIFSLTTRLRADK